MDFLFGSGNKRQIREYEKIIDKINKQSINIESLSDEELKSKTREFKDRIKNGETLDDILPEAFAVVREASKRFLGIRQYPVQLMGAIALHRGDIAEMKTGEGKTYTAPVTAYLNALSGKTVHIATSNDTLATRDQELTRPLFEGLGLTSGVVTEERDPNYEKDIKKRKEAYSCDITYGSGNAFAFDYLRDNTATSLSNVVRGDREIGLIIIDEADQILVNDAVMPFKLSGKHEDSDLSLLERIEKKSRDEKEAKEQMAIYSAADAFVSRLFKYAKTKEVKTEDEMMLYEGGNEKATNSVQRECSVLYCKGSTAVLTERGWLEAFKYFNQDKINEIANKNINKILNDPEFEIDKDYSYDEESGMIDLSLRGIEKAVRILDEVKTLNNAFYASEEFAATKKALDNALKAYFTLERGKEYILDDVKKGKTLKKRVLLVSNGRTAEGRVYSDGLQQAIEFKERNLLKRENLEIEFTEEHDELASISQKAFYSIYSKIAGMTGTSAKELFEEVYGMDTIEIPKNSEYGVTDEEIDAIYSGRVDNDTVLFATEREKMEAVIASVLDSQKKGQPVLIGTTSVNESNRLYEEFRKRGIECTKLNAETSSIKEENDIIARAGRKGSVTISTQMAGRGTDIKLGGNIDDVILELEEAEITRTINNVLHGTKVSEEEYRKLRIGATKFIETKKMDDIRAKAEEIVKREKEELVKAGGLKVIGYGHSMTRRDDDQLRGRAARQADPGVTEFYSSIKNLRKELGVSGDKIKALKKRGLAEGAPLSGAIVEKVISIAQSNNEALMTGAIVNTQEADYHLSIMRRKIYDQRMRMLKGEDPKENMEFIIETSVKNLIDRNLEENDRRATYRTKLKRSGINLNNLVVDTIETFGVDIRDALENNELSTLGDVERYVAVHAKERYYEVRKENGDEKQDVLDRDRIIGTIDDAWLTFNDNLDYIKFQNSMYSLAQNKEFDEIHAMKQGFNKAMKDAKISMLSRTIGKRTTLEREKPIEEDLFDRDESLNDYEVETKKPQSNLSVRPAKIMATLSGKIKLIKDKIKSKFELVSWKDEKEINGVERMNFENSNSSTVEETPQERTSHKK